MTPAEAIEAAELAEAEAAYRNQLAREMYQLGRQAGRAEHVTDAQAAQALLRAPPDPETIDAINRAAAHDLQAIEEARWGPGGRAHFADPRPGDFPGRGAQTQPGREAEAG